MNALLDTCVLAEYLKRSPHLGVIEWLDSQPEPCLFISALSLAELEKGIAQMAAAEPVRAERLTLWLAKLAQRFADRTLPVDAAVWRVWAQQAAQAGRLGHSIAPLQGLLLATAQCYSLTLVTRDVADFAPYPQLFNPWDLA
ncbi:type II toxin-antitoxin system VapC family toxin [Polaromonas sp.]|uniref:type II toxin-antitoxin system VapC family toxin n=1 Tax=Polaromonas sp. TaxID=1869339 RepID=UPI001799FB7A|nr:type II toxin-antitoxin system VapC family toxin [Polaromonas sp.]NMM04825.1 type II toxin-antitoxin system VapC family toxin [Polaromonas sp.]